MSDDFKSFPKKLSLETSRILLQPLQEKDIEYFSPLVKDKKMWAYFSKDLSIQNELESWIGEALTGRLLGNRIPFTIIDKKTNKICGSTSHGKISFYDKRLEIGWSWLGKEFMGTGINRNAKFALLRYAFETMKFERVEIATDNLNERANAALEKIGAIKEGVLRSRKLVHSGRRDSAYYSILLIEWESVKEKFFKGFN